MGDELPRFSKKQNGELIDKILEADIHFLLGRFAPRQPFPGR
jgi:hypothetical protein